MANQKAREYKPTTLKRLYTLSGGYCAAPDCSRKLVAKDGETMIGQVCHIEAASEQGPRWNVKMSDDQRRHFNNLIYLCSDCHSIIDNKSNETKYPANMLKQWKKEHEAKQIYPYLSKRPSLLATLVEALSNIDLDEVKALDDANNTAFRIETKIKYNSIKRNKAQIDEYKVFYSVINQLYQTLEDQGNFRKVNLFRTIRSIYLKVKGTYIEDSDNPMALVQARADDIFEDVENCLLEMLEEQLGSSVEDVSFGVTVIMIDAFMRCKILEEPPKT